MIRKNYFFVLLLIIIFREAAAQTIQHQDSPFGFLDPKIDNPTENNYEYYRDLGIKWLEFPRENSKLGWQSVEKEQSTFDFSQHDKEICEHYQQGINLIYVTRPVNSLYGTSWIEGNGIAEDEYPDGYLTNWTNFIRTVAERYDGDGINDAPCSSKIIINYYQFVHELAPLFAISDDYWQKHPDQYAEVFELTYKAIKEANPNAVLSMPVGQLLQNDNFLKSVLGYLQGKGITDIGFDYHSWNDYKERISFIKKIKETASMFGFDLSKIKIFGNESGKPDENGSREKEQAAYVVKAYAVSLANGQTKQFWTRVFDYKGATGIWPNIGLIHNPLNSDGLSHKKLAYYTYKKMVELLEGSDWNNIQTIKESDGIYIYKFIKAGTPIWVAWNDSSVVRTITISDIASNRVKITEAVPKYESGKEVIDYTKAFQTDTFVVTNGAAALTLAQYPVFIAPLTVTSVESEQESIPQEFLLYQNYPNPFNPSTTIRFSLPQREYVTLKVFDVLGREVITLVDEELNPGDHSVVFNAKGLPSGVYFYRLTAPAFSQTKSTMVLK